MGGTGRELDLLLGLFNQLNHLPRLGLGNRAGFFDLHQVAGMKLVLFIVRMVFLRTADEFAVQRMLDLALDQDRDGLVHLVAGYPTSQFAGVGRGCLLVHALFAFSPINVRTRAMSRRTFMISLVLVSCWVASCMRIENCAFSSSLSSLPRSASDLVRSSLAFIAYPTCLITKVVWIGSLAAARRNASRASVSSTPSIS